MRFPFDPSSGVGPDQVFAYETPVESADQDYGERRNRTPLRAGNRPPGSPAGKSFRFQAYHRPATGVGHFNKHLADIWGEQGVKGLREAAGVGDHLPRALRTIVTTGGCWIDCVVKTGSSHCSNRFRESAAY